MTRLGRKRAAGLTLFVLVSLTAAVLLLIPRGLCPPPGAPGNWRATAWELHPVTAIEVLR